MSTKEIGWAPANPWFESGFAHSEKVEIGNQSINTLPLSYFLATKFSAFESRGGNDPRTSHDFEDITYILDNRTDLVEEISKAPDDVLSFIKQSFQKILDNEIMQEALIANLFYETQIERFQMIIEKIKKIINN